MIRYTYLLSACLSCLLATAAFAQQPTWTLVNPQADFRARDSCAEVSFHGKLWLLGGWFDSFQPAPRDVWSSVDGKSWTQVLNQAPWKHSDLSMSLVFKDRMWMMGGWYNGRMEGHESGNEVWSSTNGLDWNVATRQAGWSPRIAAGAVVFKNRMWVLGGQQDYYFGTDDDLKNDVWSSADGAQWRLETQQAPWSPRAYHAAVVHAGKIWVLAGGNYVPQYQAHCDVWSSSDGINWECVTEKAPWDARLWFSAATYRGHIWVLGGWANHPSRNLGDVWYSADGKKWQEFKTPTVWKSRHEHSTYVHQDKLWVISGHAKPLSREVWSLSLPQDWGKE